MGTRAATLFVSAALLVGLAITSVTPADGAPQVVFSPSSMNVTANATLRTPPIVVQSATGVTMMEVAIAIPADITVNTATSGTGLVCVKKGANAGTLFFAEWDAGARAIRVSCDVVAGATLQIVEYVEFTTPAVLQMEQMGLSGAVTGGDGPATFGSLALLPPHEVTFTQSPAASPQTVYARATTSCTAAAVCSQSHAVTYAWSDGGAGGSFSNASAANPTYTAPANNTTADIAVTLRCIATCSQNSQVSRSGTVALTVRPHRVVIDAGPDASPSLVGSSGTTSCSIQAHCSNPAHSLTYAWTSGGAGSFSDPSAANPTYTATVNNTGANMTTTLTCTVRCAADSAITAVGTKAITVSPVPPKTVNVTSEADGLAYSGVSIAFSPTPDAAALASPRATPSVLSYLQSTNGVSLTAPLQDGAAHPRWFDRWKLDGVDQTAGQRTVTFNIGLVNHTAVAVYGTLVGDIDEDGDVDKSDADAVLRAAIGDTEKMAPMDVNQDGTGGPKVDIKDVRWILQHLYAGPGG